MIDIKNLRANPEIYRQSAISRGISVDIEELLNLDQQYVEKLAEVESARAILNLKTKPDEEQLVRLRTAKEDLVGLESELQGLKKSRNDLLGRVPNLLDSDTPEGGEEANLPIRDSGAPAQKSFAPLNHLSLAQAADLVDFERGAKVSGNKFYFLKGAAVRLELAVWQFACDLLEKKGFVLMSVPHLVKERIMEGTGFLPRGEENQIYKIQDEDLMLIATAENPLTGYHADETLDLDKPLYYAGLSPAYRREAGAYGKYSKGLYRVHQFEKLEMYVFCKPEDSSRVHEELIAIEEEICNLLEIPYRVVRIAAGDLGAPAYKKYDLEYYSPAEQSYRELTSCSNVTDFQARRLEIKTRQSDGSVVYAHTLNGTAVAFSRLFIALLENHQIADGRIQIPKALQHYYGKEYL